MKKFLLLLALFAFSCSEDPDNSSSVTPPNTELPDFDKDDAVTNFDKIDLILSEICYKNVSIIDEYGENSDWIEIYNKGDETINLKDYYLSDNDSATRWAFPEIDIEPKSFITVFASGKNITEVKEFPEEIDALKDDVGSWADGDRDEDDEPGKSFAKPWKFDKFVQKEDGVLKISGSLTIGDNSNLSADYRWSTALINIDLPSNNNDYSMYSAFYIKGYIDKGKKLDIVFPQTNKENWQCPEFTLIGKGNEDDEYIIPFRLEPSVETDKFESIEIRGNVSVYTTTKFTFSSMRFINESQKFHTNFGLKLGETVSLYNIDKKTKDSKEIVETAIGGSIVRDLESGKWSTTSSVTYEDENDMTESLITSTKHFPLSGFYQSSAEIRILSQSGAKVYYTLDGSIPTEKSQLYTEPFILEKTSVLRSRVIMEHGKSDITTSTYLIDEETNLPVFSLTTQPGGMFDEDTGIYMMGPNASEESPHFGANFWQDKELPVNIEFFEDDQSLQFNEQAGMKIFGNYSRANPKKSLSFRFTKSYGIGSITQKFFKYKYPHLEYFNSFVLRAGGSNSQQSMFGDGLIATLVGKVGVENQKYRPSVVFINGEYWGVHNIREKLNEHYFVTNFGLDKENINLLKENNNVQHGSGTDFVELQNFMKKNSLEDEENYAKVQDWMDVDNFIDYQTCEMYVANQDWPANNWKVWKTNDENSKWRWIIYDTDFGFGGCWGTSKPTDDMFEFATNDEGEDWPNGATSTLMFRSLLKNKEFQRRFTNRCLVITSQYFNGDDLLDSVASFETKIEKEMVRDFKRWNSWTDGREEDIARIKDFVANRYEHFLGHLIAYFEYEESYNIEFSVSGNGEIIIEGKNIGTSLKLDLIKDVKVEIEAVAKKGSSFVAWSDGSKDAKRRVDLSELSSITAEFK